MRRGTNQKRQVGRWNRLKTLLVEKYYQLMIILTIFVGSTCKANATSNHISIDDASKKVNSMFNDLYQKLLIMSLAAAVLAIVSVKTRGIVSAIFMENYLRDKDNENKTIVAILKSIGIIVLAGTLVYGFASYFGYTNS